MSEVYTLGRVSVPDDRDQQFPLRSSLPAEAEDGPSYKYWWPSGWWGNQGSNPWCVAYSWIHWLEDGPVTHRNQDYTPPLLNPGQVYSEAQRLDRWPGENYSGTSVRAGAKVLHRLGYISEYRWAWDLDTALLALRNLGPVVVGTNWYSSMFSPDSKGMMRVEGSIAGGHAYLLDGVNMDKGVVRVKNSWGRGWGKNGFAYLKFEDLSRLISEHGEVCTATEIRPSR